MPDNIAQTVQKAIQDLLVPDVKELKGSVAGIEKRLDRLENHLSKQAETQFQALMAAIGESKAQSELSAFKLISQLSERVAVLETRRQ